MLAPQLKYNLKTRIGTHDKEIKRFVYPTCHCRFSRKHGVRRHLPRRRAVYGNLKSSPSANSDPGLDSGLATSITEAVWLTSEQCEKNREDAWSFDNNDDNYKLISTVIS